VFWRRIQCRTCPADSIQYILLSRVSCEMQAWIIRNSHCVAYRHMDCDVHLGSILPIPTYTTRRSDGELETLIDIRHPYCVDNVALVMHHILKRESSQSLCTRHLWMWYRSSAFSKLERTKYRTTSTLQRNSQQTSVKQGNRETHRKHRWARAVCQRGAE
jgi:hypothetical protein